MLASFFGEIALIPTFELFGKTFGIYPVLALVGIFTAGIYACRQARKKGLDENDMIMVLLVSAVGVLLGGHLLYGLVNVLSAPGSAPNLLASDSPKAFFENAYILFGGSVFYGGLLGGIFAGALYVRKKGFALPEWADLLAPAIPLFHFFGRIGCFLGGCCYGVPCSFGFTYTHNLIEQANGVSRFPIQLVEAAFNLALFFFLWTLQKKGKFQGKRLVLYLLCYSVGRFVFEFGRGILTAASGLAYPPRSTSASDCFWLPLFFCFISGLQAGQHRSCRKAQKRRFY